MASSGVAKPVATVPADAVAAGALAAPTGTELGAELGAEVEQPTTAATSNVAANARSGGRVTGRLARASVALVGRLAIGRQRRTLERDVVGHLRGGRPPLRRGSVDRFGRSLVGGKLVHGSRDIVRRARIASVDGYELDPG